MDTNPKKTPELRNTPENIPFVELSLENEKLLDWTKIVDCKINKLEDFDGDRIVRLDYRVEGDNEARTLLSVFTPDGKQGHRLLTSAQVDTAFRPEDCNPSSVIDINAISLLADTGSLIEGLPEAVPIKKNENVERILAENAEKLKSAIDTVKVISLDIDDTLMPTTSPMDQLRWVNEIKTFKDNLIELDKLGIKIIANTGRGIGDVKKVLGMLNSAGCNITEAICENGSIIFDLDTGKYEINPDIDKTSLSVKDNIKTLLAEVLAKDPRLGKFEDGKAVGVSINLTEQTLDAIDVNMVEAAENDRDIDIFKKWIVGVLLSNKSRVMRTGSPEESDAFDAIIHQITNSSTAVDINPSRKLDDGTFVGIDKECGTDIYLAENGLKPEEVIVGGDSSGDKGAVMSAGYYFAVPNGSESFMTDPEISEKLIYVPDKGFAAGVNQFLRYIINNKERQGKE